MQKWAGEKQGAVVDPPGGGADRWVPRWEQAWKKRWVVQATVQLLRFLGGLGGREVGVAVFIQEKGRVPRWGIAGQLGGVFEMRIFFNQ